MGADFKEKTRRTFEKCWDNAAVEANTPDLFSKANENAADRFEAEPINGSAVSVGDTVCVRVENGKLIGRRGLSPVLTIAAPTPALVQAVADGCNVARADVVAADPISGIFEVTIS